MTWPFAWYIAESLEVLRRQLNALAPRRSTASDGGIGDYAHSQRTSDHNPNTYRNSKGERQVCARDFTHDPGDLDCHSLAARLTASGDNRIKYIIWNRRIWEPGSGWQPYHGANPHTQHLHLSVRAGALGDVGRAWNLGQSPGQPADQGEDMDSNQDRMLREVTAVVTGAAGPTYPADGPGLRARIAGVEGKVDSTATKVNGIDARLNAVADMCEAILAKLNETPEGGA